MILFLKTHPSTKPDHLQNPTLPTSHRAPNSASMASFFHGFLLFFLFLVPSALSQIPLDQRTTMINLASKLSSSKWNTTDPNPCNWNGVTCSENFITHLSFSGFGIHNPDFLFQLCDLNSLQGLDFSINFLISIPASFLSSCKNTSLKMLNFSNNQIFGVLPSFQDLGSLEFLDISHNQINGTLVSQFEGLFQIKNVDLSFNLLSGSVPSNFGEGMVLGKLQLSNNHFTGVFPEALLDYTNLTLLDLSVNSLSGVIPVKIEKLTKLEILVLSLNNLTDEIPQSLSRITTLYRFAANQNRFTGTIPSGISSHLKILDLSYNRLVGLIPSDLLAPANLQSIDLTGNLLEGGVPTDISNGLFRLRLGSNFLNGSVPPAIGSVSNLTYLEMDNNRLTGTIPVELQNCTKLELLNLAQNDLEGSLPTQLGNLSQLKVMKLNQNKFAGVIPEGFSQLEKLFILNLSQNSLSGSIPSSISILPSLSSLNLGNNGFTGSIPDTFVNLNSLMELQLGHNKLSGKIPRMPSSLQFSLNLSSNLFQGSIPSTLAGLTNLEVLDLSNNQFTGEVPDFLTTMGSLTMLVLSNNQLSGTLPQFKDFVVVDVTGNDYLVKENPNSTPPIVQKKRNPHALLTAITVACAVFTVGLMMILVLIYRCSCKTDGEIPEPEEHTVPQVIDGNLITTNIIHRSNIDFTKAVEAVSDPANVMLKNRFSTYYKAVMPSGTAYCVKKLNWSDKVFLSGSHGRFGRELEDLGRLSNPNIMIPLAYVLTDDSAYLFYEYVHKGSLFDFLHSSSGTLLDWDSRYDIALGAAQGLAFLHECANPIVHFDLSSKSILLRSLSEPQIGDIELCKVIDPSKSTGSLSTVAGSVGYIPPEYAYTMRVTLPGNVYSFGVILLELLTGKPTVSEGIELTKWVLAAPSRNDPWEQILDPSISKTSLKTRNQMLLVLKFAQACVCSSPEVRPKMRSVVRMLLTVKQDLK